MIDLTPIDVRKKKNDLKRKLRGYHPDEVDDFLSLAADRLEEVVNQNLRLEERVRYLEDQVRHYQERERALTEALVSAQELREEVQRQATKEANLVRREAEVEAERIRSAAARTREQEEDAVRRLRARRTQILRTFRTFLERELSELSVVEHGLEAADASEAAEEAADPLASLDLSDAFVKVPRGSGEEA